MNEKEDIKDYFKDETVETSNNNNILLENEEYNNIKEGMELSDKDMLNILNKEVHGVIMRVHPKKYPGYGWGGPSDKNHRYFSKISYEFLQPDDPYAKIDDNLRQLKLYTENDIRPYYNMDKKINKSKMPENRYNQFYQKGMYFYPNTRPQSLFKNTKKEENIGGKKKKNIRNTKNKLKRKKTNKTKKRRHIKKR